MTGPVPGPANGVGRARRPPAGVLLVPRLTWYHLILVVRSPIGTFISLVVPVMLLVALDLVTPETTLQSLGGVHVAQFLTPAMASFAVLNVGFVDVVIGVTLARDEGVLRRYRCSAASPSAYFIGRFVTAALVASVAVGVVCFVGLVLLGARLPSSGVGTLVAGVAAGLVVSFSMGLAVGALVPSALSALPIAYALLLPVAFISQMFFPAPTEAHWLRAVARALPVQPFVQGVESAFSASPHGTTAAGWLVLGLWTAGALGLAVATFSWEPDGAGRWDRFARLLPGAARR